jgi:hypothetical protein
MGAEEFRKAPMMHHKLTTLARIRYTTEPQESEVLLIIRYRGTSKIAGQPAPIPHDSLHL